MDEIGKLVQLLQEVKTPNNLSQTLHSDSVKPGLERLHSILKQSIEPIADDGKLGFESWSSSQIQVLISILKLYISATRSLSVQQAEPLVVAIVEKSLEFLLSFLEKSVYSTGDLSLQDSVVQLLEITLIDRLDKESSVALEPYSVDALEVLSPIVQYGTDIVELGSLSKCTLEEGTYCSREDNSVDRVLMTLSSDFFRPSQGTDSSELIFRLDLDNVISLSRHLAVVHMRCIPRLVRQCKELFCTPKILSDEIDCGSSCMKLSFSLRILRFLVDVTKDSPYLAYDSELLQAVASCADALPRLFRTNIEFVKNSSSSEENNFESLVLILLEEFLHFVQVSFCDGNILRNIQICIAASVFDILEARVWRYNKSATDLKPPLACFPQSVINILKLVGDVKQKKFQSLNRRDHGKTIMGTDINAASCSVRSEKVSLLKEFTWEESLQIILSPSTQWVDNLMHLAFFLHLEGVKLKPKVERSQSLPVKTGGTPDMDGAVSHEDDALFGDLFSEVGRSATPTEGPELPSTAFNCISSYCHLPIQAASELLSFLKSCIFSAENSSIYDDGCKKLHTNHIDFLLSILNCQTCLSEERSSDSGAELSSQFKPGNINEVCFGLFHNLLTRRAFSDPLEEYLVDQILNVENGLFVYNDHTLSLLAHTLISRVGQSGIKLRTNIFQRYVGFIIEKTNIVSLKCPSIRELLGTIPCVFHIEILFMAFHLSSEVEKKTLASLVLSSIKGTSAPKDESSNLQLSCWALLVSRLVVVLRYMMFYPSTCPSWLLLDMRERLRDAPFTRLCHPNDVNNRLLSWPCNVIETLIGEWIKQEPVINILVHQLIDVGSLSASVCKDPKALDCLCLSWDDVCASVSWILGFWRGKKAENVEDLILERYIFVLCWDIPVWSSSKPLLSPENDMSNMEYFSLVRRFLANSSGVMFKDANNVTSDFLNELYVSRISDNVERLGWDFLRDGACLSLFLSLFNAGILRYYGNDAIPKIEPHRTGAAFRDNSFLSLAESMITNLVQVDHIGWLFKVFSSLLQKYLQVHQRTFVHTLDREGCHEDRFSPLLLVKHAEFDKFRQAELLDKSGSTPSELNSVQASTCSDVQIPGVCGYPEAVAEIPVASDIRKPPLVVLWE